MTAAVIVNMIWGNNYLKIPTVSRRIRSKHDKIA